MNPSSRSRIEKLFSAALDRPLREREAFLREACGQDSYLFREICSLLEADAHGDDLLERGAADAILEDLESSLLDRRIGPYRVSALLSTGPMGWVLRATRDDGQFDRDVILKLFPAVGDPHERARFLEERQILASLGDHRIAQLYEGGCTVEGWPWFAMEEVHGVRITDWCDQHALPLKDRLHLFIEVCRAVDDAHRRLVVHCDLKPENILIAESAQVRLIDFGIARLIPSGESATSPAAHRYLSTEYASPEQLRGQELGTATDVYSLGAVLYRLLTGAVPFPCSTLEISALLAARDQELIPPSQRVCESPTLPVRSRELRGDLDLLLARALEPSLQNRMASAGELADEIERILAHRPLRIREGERGYSLSRAVRRHRLALAIGGLALILGVVTGAHGFRQARILAQRSAALQRERNRAQHATQLLTQMFDLVDPYAPTSAVGDTMSVASFLQSNRNRMMEETADSPVLRAEVTLLLARLYGNLGRYDEALPLITESVDKLQSTDPGNELMLADAINQLGLIQMKRGEYEEARIAFRKALDLRRHLAHVPPTDLAQSLSDLAVILSRSDSLDTAIVLDEEALRLRRAAPRSDELKIAESLNNLGADSYFLEQDNRSIDYYEHALRIRERALGEHHPLVADTRSSLARVYSEIGQVDRARELYLAALDGWRESLGADHSQCTIATYHLSRLAREQGNREEAIRWMRETLRIVCASLPESHPWRTNIANQLAELLETTPESSNE